MRGKKFKALYMLGGGQRPNLACRPCALYYLGCHMIRSWSPTDTDLLAGTKWCFWQLGLYVGSAQRVRFQHRKLSPHMCVTRGAEDLRSWIWGAENAIVWFKLLSFFTTCNTMLAFRPVCRSLVRPDICISTTHTCFTCVTQVYRLLQGILILSLLLEF